jgi:hypothetical protein
MENMNRHASRNKTNDLGRSYSCLVLIISWGKYPIDVEG